MSNQNNPDPYDACFVPEIGEYAVPESGVYRMAWYAPEPADCRAKRSITIPARPLARGLDNKAGVETKFEEDLVRAVAKNLPAARVNDEVAAEMLSNLIDALAITTAVAAHGDREAIDKLLTDCDAQLLEQATAFAPKIKAVIEMMTKASKWASY